LLDDRQRCLIAMFDEGRDACRGAANDSCIRTEHVARHKHRQGISEEDHLGSAATHQVDNTGLHAGKDIDDAGLATSSRPGMTIIKAASYTASNRYFRPPDRRESAPAHCWFASDSWSRRACWLSQSGTVACSP
jgi:hypothetical protein